MKTFAVLALACQAISNSHGPALRQVSIICDKSVVVLQCTQMTNGECSSSVIHFRPSSGNMRSVSGKKNVPQDFVDDITARNISCYKTPGRSYIAVLYGFREATGASSHVRFFDGRGGLITRPKDIRAINDIRRVESGEHKSLDEAQNSSQQREPK